MILRFLREKAAWLLSGFLLLALLSFILGDFLVGRKGISSHSATDDAIIGQIGDRIIKYTEFNDLVTNAIKRQKAINQSPQGSTDLNDAIMYTNTVQAIWNQILSETLINKATSAMGMIIGKDELFDMVEGGHIDPEVKQFFGVDPNNSIDPNIIHNFIDRLSSPGSEQLRYAWNQFEHYLINKRLTSKYINLLSASVFMNSLETKSNNEFSNTKANLDYILVPYDYIKGDKYNLTDKEIQLYYDDHKNTFKNDQEIRNVNYAVLNIVPSAEDSLKTKNSLEALIPKFSQTNQDSLFASINSDYNNSNQLLISYSSKNDLNSSMANALFSSKKGYVYGPYMDGNTYKLAKLIYVRNLYDEINVKHILFNAREPISKVKDILKDIQTNKKSFQDAAKDFSIDPQTKANGGEIGWLNLNMPIPESIKDSCFKKDSPNMQIVKSELGIHIIAITGRRNLGNKAKIAYISKNINASQTTRDAFFAKMNNALSELNKTNDMNAVASKFGLQYFANEHISPWGPYNNLDDPNSHIETYKHRKLIQWSFKSNKGDISPIVEENNSYSIAQVIKINKKGYKPLNEVKSSIKIKLEKEKKSDVLINDISNYAKGNNTNLETLAKHFNTSVKKDYSMNMLSDSYKIYGAVLGTKIRSLSKPINDKNGVYLLYINNKTTSSDSQSLEQWQNQQIKINEQMLLNDMLKVLETGVKIIDNRVILL